jgi:pimeloyl-ACP methyl ester carboxylesterase
MNEIDFQATMPQVAEPREWSKYGVIASALLVITQSGWVRKVGIGALACSGLHWTAVQIIEHSVYMGWCTKMRLKQDQWTGKESWLTQRWNFWHPNGCLSQEVSITLDGGLTIDARFLEKMVVQGEELVPSKEVVILCSGNGGIYELSTPLWLLDNFPMSICVYNPPGYGESTGQRTLRTDFQAIDGVIEFLMKKKGFREEQIHIVGMSLGSGPASWVASRYKVKTLALLVPVGRMEDVVERIIHQAAGRHLGSCVNWFVAPIVRRYYGYDNVDALEKSQAERFYFYEAGQDSMMTVGGVPECKKLAQAWLKDHSPDLIDGLHDATAHHVNGLNYAKARHVFGEWDLSPLTKEEVIENYWPTETKAS